VSKGRSRLPALLCFAVLAIPSGGAAQDLGLLLGVSDDYRDRRDTGFPQRFSTYWITWRNGRAENVRRMEGLVVPRASGFWRLAVTRACSGTTGDEMRCADTLWAAPGSRPLPRIRAWKPDDPICAYRHFEILFASPTVLSVVHEEGGSEACDPDTERSYTVRTYESPEPVRFSSLGQGAAAAFQDAAKRAINYGGAPPPQPQDEMCHTDPEEDASWIVNRAATAWIAELLQERHRGICRLSAPIKWELPTSLVGYEEAMLDSSAIGRALPGALQAFPSPGGTVALVVYRDTMRLHSLLPGALEATLLDLPKAEVVMVQWATGRSVARWTQMLAPLGGQRPPQVTPRAPFWTLTFRGAGPVRFGMTIDEATRAANDDETRRKPTTGDCEDWMPDAGKYDPTVPVFQVRQRQVTHATIVFPEQRVAGGGTVDMTEEALRRLYHDQLKAMPDPQGSPADRWLVHEPTAKSDSLFRIVFATDGHRVRFIRAGMLPDVLEYGECR